jgi:hypothetical protein
VNVVGTGAPAGARAQAPWVDPMLAQERALQTEAYQNRMSEPLTAGDRVFMSGFMAAVLGVLLGGVAAPLWAMWKWRGGWRMAAALPAALLAFVIARILIGTTIDPKSHNLWPFEILLFGAASLAIMAALAIARRLTRA